MTTPQIRSSLIPGHKMELCIFSAHLMFSVEDDPSQHLQRLQSKILNALHVSNPRGICSRRCPAASATTPGVMGEILSEKLKCSTNGCITAALLLLSRLFVRSARVPTQRPTTYVSLFSHGAAAAAATATHSAKEAKTLLLRVSAPEELLWLSLFLRDPRCVRFLHKYFIGRRAEIKASLSCRAVMIPRREHLNTPPPPLFSLGFLQCKHQPLQRCWDLPISRCRFHQNCFFFSSVCACFIFLSENLGCFECLRRLCG